MALSLTLRTTLARPLARGTALRFGANLPPRAQFADDASPVPRQTSVWAPLLETDLFRKAMEAYQQPPPPKRRSGGVERVMRLKGVRSALNPDALILPLRRSVVFTPEEDRSVIAMLKEGLGWKEIAQNLSKTVKQVHARFANAIDPRLRFGEFSEYEDEAIRAHVNTHGPSNWSLLSRELGFTRTNVALNWRWNVALANREPWSDDERRRLLEGIATHGRDWDAVTRHVGGGRTATDCMFRWHAARRIIGRANVHRRYSDDEDSRLVAAVGAHGRNWSEIAKEFTERSPVGLCHRYTRSLLPKWLRVPIRDDIAALERILRAPGRVDEPLADMKVPENAAQYWVALSLGMDDPSQVNWTALNSASGGERGAAIDAVRSKLLPRLSAKDWLKDALRVWVPAWSWPRPICERKHPIRAVASNEAIRPFVRPRSKKRKTTAA